MLDEVKKKKKKNPQIWASMNMIASLSIIPFFTVVSDV